jgi:hypothetical protein
MKSIFLIDQAKHLEHKDRTEVQIPYCLLLDFTLVAQVARGSSFTDDQMAAATIDRHAHRR